MPSVLLLTNADAGTHDEEAVDIAVTRLRAGGLDIELVGTRGPNELDAALGERHGRDVVVSGGDGSLHAVVTALRRRGELGEPVIGLIPLGTGNDFARGIQLPLDPDGAAQVIVSGRKALVDVLVDEQDMAVINAVHCGAGADAGREAQPWKAQLGRLGYVVGAIKAGFTSESHRLRVVADGVVLADGRRRVLQAVVANGPFVGGGTPLAPDADPTDGLADVLVSFADAPLARLAYLVRLRRGTHDERHDVQVARAQNVSITGETFWCNADGEFEGPVNSKSWTLHPQSLTMMLPTPAQAVQSSQGA